MNAPVAWNFRPDRGYDSKFEIRIEREFVLRLSCVCEKYTIPTTHPGVVFTKKSLALLKKKYDRHVPISEADGLLKLIPDTGIRLYTGAALGGARVVNLKSANKDEFAWDVMTPILKKSNLTALQDLLGDSLPTRAVENLDSFDKLFEILREPIDLNRIYPKTKCTICHKPDTSSIDRKEITLLLARAAKGKAIHELPGGCLLVSDKFKRAVESLGFKNAKFEPFILEDYLKNFASVS